MLSLKRWMYVAFMVVVVSSIFMIYSVNQERTKNIQIKNGEFLLSSSDVGLHADEEITIEGGSFNITKSYEGIEAANIIILDGTISVTRPRYLTKCTTTSQEYAISRDRRQ